MAITITYNQLHTEFNNAYSVFCKDIDLDQYIKEQLEWFTEKGSTVYYKDKNGVETCIKAINHHLELKEYDIWMSGYAATGESSSAHLLGKVKARNFAPACHIYYCKEFLEYANKYNDPGYRDYIDSSRWDYDPHNLSIWGCSLHWKEEVARRSFG